MYPQRELTRLGAAKRVCAERIQAERVRSLGAARSILRPLVTVDRVLACWRALFPAGRSRRDL